jgi:hypothetical protein
MSPGRVRHLLPGALAAVLALAGAVRAGTLNYVPNAGFESCSGAPTAWTAQGVAMPLCSSASPHAGSFSLSLTSESGATYAGAQSECVSVPGNTLISTFAFSYRTSASDVLQVAFTANTYNGSDCTGGTGIASVGAGASFVAPLLADGDWHTVSLTALTGASTQSVRFVTSFQRSPAGMSTVDFDSLVYSADTAGTTTSTTTTSTSSIPPASTTSTTLPGDLVYPGTGKPASECYVTLRGVAATAPGKIACVDGAPTCDADGAADGTCTFAFRVCVAQALPGCQAISITSVTAAPSSLGIAAPPVPASAPVCGDPAQVIVPLRKGGTKAGRKKLLFAARNSEKPKVDRDRVRLECQPPS